MKRTQDQQFLFEASVEDKVDDVIRQLVEVHNLRLRIERLALEGEELAKHGPAKPYEEQGLDEEVEDMPKGYSMEGGDMNKQGTKERGPFYNADPLGKRTGEACDPTVAEVLRKTLMEATQLASKDQVECKKPLTKTMLEEAIMNIKGATMICYPMGLPIWDPVRQALEDKEDLTGTSYSQEVLEPDTAQLWWAGKQLAREKKLGEHVGKNDKTKITAKLTKKGAGAPAREPPVDQETQKAMMAWYYKKQQEQKELEEDDDDSYSNSEWANPKALKRYFSGVGALKLR
ncbi:hypothetical protein CBR_g29428 [Chara braunii]|uniref:Uncharacterized protein n=1 Tax=Chara braunii TaxID=69332 RepID=A0A388LAF3_CHABU|nr:hypothetical protein CBR_g29428 [Chara braunii]|eukprot:GBG79278.1 hypothetical protein CBR_g29428 [Chara braunii]